MKPTPDDPRLSAFVLGELSAEEAAEIERAAAADPATRMTLAELEKTASFLGGVLSPEGANELLPGQREAILRASRDADSLGKVIELESAKRGWRPWLAGIGSAAVVAFAALLMSRVAPDDGPGLVDGLDNVPEEVALLPLPGPAIGGGTTQTGASGSPAGELARNLETRPGEYLEKVARHFEKSPLPETSNLPPTGTLGGFSASTATRLPILVGTSSYRWVSGWVRERGELPPKHAVRIEELVNIASLPKGIEVGGLEVSVERSDCPWNHDSYLVGLQLIARGGNVEGLKVTAQDFGDHRILGSFSMRHDEALPTTLPEGRRTLVLIEVRGPVGLRPEGRPLFQVEQGDQPARSISAPDQDARPSPGMNHSVTLAGFGMWLRGEGVSGDRVRKLLKTASSDSDPVRADQRRMMEEALKLAESER